MEPKFFDYCGSITPLFIIALVLYKTDQHPHAFHLLPNHWNSYRASDTHILSKSHILFNSSSTFLLAKASSICYSNNSLACCGVEQVRYLKLCNNDVIIITSHKYTIRRVRVIMMIREMNFVLLRDLVKKVACLSLRLRHPGGM